MTRFRPTVEVLAARTLPSAVTAAPVPPVAEAAQIAAPSSEHATGDVVGIAGKVAFQDINFTKVTFQDIHFTQTVSKASPKLML
jgi:hypothetical protein